jgi:MFS transporter, DHA2 family, multidrug resistance protein
MKIAQTRFIIGAGFFIMGCAFFYSSQLTPDIDFKTLVIMRAAQTAGLAFLFGTVAFVTIPRELIGDATALYTMLRNVFGSVGISLASATIIERTQVHQSYLAQWATPLHQAFNELVTAYQRALIAMGHAASAAHEMALGRAYQVYQRQAEILAYSDVFYYVSLVAFAVVPLCFFLSSVKGSSDGAAH